MISVKLTRNHPTKDRCLVSTHVKSYTSKLSRPPLASLSTMTISSSKPTQLRLSSQWSNTSPSTPSTLPQNAATFLWPGVASPPALLRRPMTAPTPPSGRISTLRLLTPLGRPSSSHTRISSPRELTLTAFPRAVISASLMPEVWPQSRMPGEMDRVVEVEVQR